MRKRMASRDKNEYLVKGFVEVKKSVWERQMDSLSLQVSENLLMFSQKVWTGG